MPEFWEGRTFCLITGASRGIGQAISVEFAKFMSPDSAILLLARNSQGLDQTKSQTEKAAPKVKVVTQSIDLSNCNSQICHQSVTSALASLGQKADDYDHAILVHNAASLGRQVNVASLERKDVESQIALNLVSPICLNAEFLKVFTKGRRTIVQVTSQAAVMANPTAGLYCASKTWRDMIFACMAIEEPTINILNYAPGVVATDMLSEFMEKMPIADKDRKKIKEANVVITPTQSAHKLAEILKDGKYKSGEHVDYYGDAAESTYANFAPSDM